MSNKEGWYFNEWHKNACLAQKEEESARRLRRRKASQRCFALAILALFQLSIFSIGFTAGHLFTALHSQEQSNVK